MWPFSKHSAFAKATRSDIINALPWSLIRLVFDRTYSLPTDKAVISALGVDRSKYIPESADCDDFAFRAKGKLAGKGWPFGVAFIDGKHMVNIWVNDHRQIVLLEPQTRNIIAEHPTRYDAIII